MRIEHTFSSLSEFLDVVKRHPRVSGARNSSETGSYGFTQTSSYSEAERLSETGWTEGREKISALSATLTKRIAVRMHKPVVHFDVCGDTFDVGRVVTGNPEAFMVWETEEIASKGNKIIKIVCSTSISGGVPADVIIARGAAVCALAECLESVGYRVELWTNLHTKAIGSSHTLEYSICIKESTQQLQMDQLAFVFVHPSFLRRIEFRFEESSYLPAELAIALTTKNYGTPAEPSEHMKGDITLGSMRYGDANFSSPEAAEQWVIRQLKAQGIEAENE